MGTAAMVNKAFDDIKNGSFSQAKPILKSILGKSVNQELEARDFDKVKCTIPDISDED